jgi:hypothetical protein
MVAFGASILYNALHGIDLNLAYPSENIDIAPHPMALPTGETVYEALINPEDNACGVRVFGYVDRAAALKAAFDWPL